MFWSHSWASSTNWWASSFWKSFAVSAPMTSVLHDNRGPRKGSTGSGLPLATPQLRSPSCDLTELCRYLFKSLRGKSGRLLSFEYTPGQETIAFSFHLKQRFKLLGFL